MTWASMAKQSASC